MARKDDLPSTVARSGKKAQDTWGETHDSAVTQYGEGGRAHRTAFASLKHTHEKVGDHWEPKPEAGPSDAQAEQSGSAARDRPRATHGGVDANATKAHLMDQARTLEVAGRSTMTKAELVRALEAASRRETARARGD